jgi:gliding motility-associated-like protein
LTFTNTSPAGPYQYLWNFGTGGGFTNLGAGNKSTSYGAPGTYTVRMIVAVAGSSSCRDTASWVVNIIAAPVGNFSYAPSAGCTSVITTFTESSTDAITWNWNFNNGNTFVGQNPPAQTFTAQNAPYTVSLVVTGSTSCVHTRTASIVVRYTPIPNFPVFANCVFAVSNFSSTSTIPGTVAITSYTWDFGDGTPKSNSLTPAHTYTAPNTYTVKLIAETPFCKDSVSKNIVINLKPVANFVPTPTIGCPPFVSTFSNTTLNGVNSLWRFGTVASATSNVTSPSFTYNNSSQSNQNYTITLISLTGAGCADSIKKVIAVYPKPVASYSTVINSGCSPIPITFSNTSIGANTFSWTLGDGSTDTQTLVSHTYTNTGLTQITRTVQLIVVNNDGCRDTTRNVVFVNPSPAAAFSISPGFGCGPLEVNFSPALGAISYTWDYGDGSPISNAINPPHTYNNNGQTDLTFTINLAITNAYLCTGSVAATATVYGRPIANFSLNPGVGCSPLPINYFNGSIDNASNLWRFGNGATSIASDPLNTFFNNPGDPQQAFTTKLVVTNTRGCKDSTTRQITLLAQPSSSFTPDTPACSPKVIKFTNQSSTNATTYNWTFGNGSAPSTAPSPEVLYSNPTGLNMIFAVSLTSRTNDGCTNTFSVPVTVYPKPNFFVNASPDSGCSPLRVRFIKNAGAAKHRYDFERTGSFTGLTATDVNYSYVNTTGFDKTFEAVMIAEDGHGCLDTAMKFFKVFPNPTAKFTAIPLEVFTPSQPTNFSNASVLATKYFWEFGDGGTSTENSPSYIYVKPGEYEIKLTVETPKGCKDTYILPEKVKALDETSVQMPNAFSPDPSGPKGRSYDGNSIDNDIFHPLIAGAEKYLFSIYSRWGELLFETNNQEEGWDGYYKGKLCTQDVYIWKIAATFADGKTYNKTGDLFLLRTDQ